MKSANPTPPNKSKALSPGIYSWEFRPKIVIFNTVSVFRPGISEIISSLLRLEQEQKGLLNFFSNSHLSFSLSLIWN